MNINTITYGNPTIQQKIKIENSNFLDALFKKFQESPFPVNNSDTTRAELNSLTAYLKQIVLPENKEYLDNYLIIDRNFGQAIINIFKHKEIDLEDLVQNIIEDIQPLLIKLKFFYNRPRPFQLANNYNLKLFPFESKSSNSPSYPSGQVLMSSVILNVIREKHPEHEELCVNSLNMIIYSRLYLGLNYQSDVDFALEISEEIILNKKFSAKYDI